MHHFQYEAGARFTAALRSAIEDEEVSDRIRSALLAVYESRDERTPVDPAARKLWAYLADIRVGRGDELRVRALAHEIVKR